MQVLRTEWLPAGCARRRRQSKRDETGCGLWSFGDCSFFARRGRVRVRRDAHLEYFSHGKRRNFEIRLVSTNNAAR